MALPIILIDSNSGSNTVASGAGPTTALSGTTDASTDATGLIVTLTAGLDISGVATDGSSVIFLNDTTAGARNFGKITGSAGSGGATPNVTVANAFGLSLSGKSWAIGGKRLSLVSTTTRKLCDNNGGSGDAMPGWVMEFQSAHAETHTATLDCRRAGDTTSGPIILRGVSGAATLPIITFTNNGNCFVDRNDNWQFRDFEIRNTNATKTASVAINPQGLNFVCERIKISHSTDKFWKGLVTSVGGTGVIIKDCEFGYCASIGIDWASGQRVRILNCWVHDCGSHGISVSSDILGGLVYGTNSSSNAGDGLNISGGNAAANRSIDVIQCTFNGNTGDGLEITISTGTALDGIVVMNNICSNNGGYGINLSAASMSIIKLAAVASQFLNNALYTNTSGATLPASVGVDTVTTNPTFANAAGGDYSIGTNLKANGYPLGGSLPVGKYSSTYSYVDPGCAQRQEAGGGLLTARHFGGGIN